MKKILNLLGSMALIAALFIGCNTSTSETPTNENTNDGNTSTEKTTIVLTEKYAAWSQIDIFSKIASLTEEQKASAKIVIEISDAEDVQAGWGYGAAYIWHSWAEGDSSQSEKLLLTAPADASSTGFTSEWALTDILSEYKTSDVGFGINFWGAIANATIKVTLVY